jgi:ketosteroid isomerase-like protein
MSSQPLRDAYEALAAGDLEPLVSLMSDDMVWRGVANPWRFWQPVPS